MSSTWTTTETDAAAEDVKKFLRGEKKCQN